MTILINKIKKYLRDQSEQEQLKSLMQLDYRLEKEIMAIRKQG